MSLITKTFTAPSYWASYLINGDASGLDDDEQRACDQWLDDVMSNNPKLYGPTNWQDKAFRRNHDAWAYSPYAGDITEYTFNQED